MPHKKQSRKQDLNVDFCWKLKLLQLKFKKSKMETIIILYYLPNVLIFLSPRWHWDVIYTPPLVISSSCRLNSCGLRAFSVLGLRLWNSLPRLLRDTSHNTTSFGHSLTIFFFSQSTSAYIAHWGLWRSLCTIQINALLTYLLIKSTRK